jgi:hypothetical protein
MLDQKRINPWLNLPLETQRIQLSPHDKQVLLCQC